MATRAELDIREIFQRLQYIELIDNHLSDQLLDALTGSYGTPNIDNKFVTEEDPRLNAGSGISDHGVLSGLNDDDHPLYLTSGRADAIYYRKTDIDNHVNNSAIHFTVSSIDHGLILGLSDDDHSQYLTSGRANTWFLTETTTNLTEGTNLYYTDNRVDARISGVIASGVVTDHGILTGLSDDDHIQYLTSGRASGLFYGKTEIDIFFTQSGVTNGNSHDHSGGDGNQISHLNLSNIGTNSHITIDDFIASKAQASGLASLNSSSLVVQDPANATVTPTSSKIPIADGSAKLDSWITSNAAAGTPSLRQLGTGATDACAGNDSRLTNDRTANALRTASNTVSISASTAPATNGYVLVTTSSSVATWQLISNFTPAIFTVAKNSWTASGSHTTTSSGWNTIGSFPISVGTTGTHLHVQSSFTIESDTNGSTGYVRLYFEDGHGPPLTVTGNSTMMYFPVRDIGYNGAIMQDLAMPGDGAWTVYLQWRVLSGATLTIAPSEKEHATIVGQLFNS
jgi:hypothetical protein